MAVPSLPLAHFLLQPSSYSPAMQATGHSLGLPQALSTQVGYLPVLLYSFYAILGMWVFSQDLPPLASPRK